MNVPIRRPYVTDFLLGPDARLKIVRCNTVLDSTSHVIIIVPGKVIELTVCIKNAVIGSTYRVINTVLVD